MGLVMYWRLVLIPESWKGKTGKQMFTVNHIVCWVLNRLAQKAQPYLVGNVGIEIKFPTPQKRKSYANILNEHGKILNKILAN